MFTFQHRELRDIKDQLLRANAKHFILKVFQDDKICKCHIDELKIKAAAGEGWQQQSTGGPVGNSHWTQEKRRGNLAIVSIWELFEAVVIFQALLKIS